MGPMPPPPPALKGAAIASSSNEQILEDQQTEFEFALYPNPATGKVFVDFNLEQPSDVSIRLYGLDGRLVIAKELGALQKGNHSQSVSLENLDDGMYVLELHGGTKLIREKFFISK